MSNSLADEAMCFGLSSWEMLLILSELSCSVSFLPVAPITHDCFSHAGSAYCSTAYGWFDLLPFVLVTTTAYVC